VNPSPGTGSLIVTGSNGVALSNNGQKVRRTYYFNGGDPTTISSISTSTTGVTATVVGVGPNTATVEYVGSGSMPTGSSFTVTAHTPAAAIPVGVVYPLGGPTISVNPSSGPPETYFVFTPDFGAVPALSGDLSVAGPGGPAGAILWPGDNPIQYTVAGHYIASMYVLDDDLPSDEPSIIESPPVSFDVSSPPPPPPPTISSISVMDANGNVVAPQGGSYPVGGTSVTIIVSGSGFGASGLLQACDSSGNNCTTLQTTGPWSDTTFDIWWNIPTVAAGLVNTFCLKATANFAGGSPLTGGCFFFQVVAPPAPATPTLQLMMQTWDKSSGLSTPWANIAGTTQTLLIGQEFLVEPQITGGNIANYTFQWTVTPATYIAGARWVDIDIPSAVPPAPITLSGTDPIKLMWTNCASGTPTAPNCNAGTTTLTATPVAGSGAPATSGPVQATFTIIVPQVTPVINESGSVSNPGPGTLALPDANGNGSCIGVNGGSMCLNTQSGSPNSYGINFSVSAPAGYGQYGLPAGWYGRFEWLQVVTSAAFNRTDQFGNVCVVSTYGLDNAKPADNTAGQPHVTGGLYAWDAPSVPLDPWVKTGIYPPWSFTTFLMFAPTDSKGESTNINSRAVNDNGTLVPLYSFQWVWGGEADIVAAGPPSTWISKSGADAIDVNGAGNPTDPTTPAPATAYPQWTQVVDPGAACVLMPPITNGVSPSSGPPGTLVTITGNNFGSAQGGSTVKFGILAATVSGAGWSTNGNSIQVVVPALSPGQVGVVVTVAGASSSPFAFAVTQ